jgi:hypothetical protein
MVTSQATDSSYLFLSVCIRGPKKAKGSGKLA